MPARGRNRKSRRTNAYKHASGCSFNKLLDRRWPTRDQPLNVADRHLDGRPITEALIRTCADCKNKSAQRQSGRRIRFVRRFLRSTKRPRVESFIAMRPIVGRRVLTKRKLRIRRVAIPGGGIAESKDTAKIRFESCHGNSRFDPRMNQFQMLVAYLSGLIDSVE